MAPIDRDQRIALSRLRLAVGGKLSRAMRLIPLIDPSKGERDAAGDELENILLSITCEDLAYLTPPASDEQVRTLADQRAEALRAARLDVVVERIAVRAQRLGHMIAIGASRSFIDMAGYETSLRVVVDELCARAPFDGTEEATS